MERLKVKRLWVTLWDSPYTQPLPVLTFGPTIMLPGECYHFTEKLTQRVCVICSRPQSGGASNGIQNQACHWELSFNYDNFPITLCTWPFSGPTSRLNYFHVWYFT